MIRFYRIPQIFRFLSRHLHWRIPTCEKEIYLTFDDGPIPYLTEYVIDQLAVFDAKATFFCVGDNIRKHPEVIQKVIEGGHSIGNHTYNHLKAWSTDFTEYLDNVSRCDQIIKENTKISEQKFFRPPYGQITRKAIAALKEDFKIIMWDVLTYDFDLGQSAEKSLSKAIRSTNPGSIVVFHDNYKAEEKLRYMLPRYLEHFSDLGYKFKKLSMD